MQPGSSARLASLPVRLMRDVRRSLPRGGSLPDDTWAARHRGVVALLWVHAAFVPVYALILGYSVVHSLTEGAILPAIGLLAIAPGLTRRTRTAMASIGLLTASAILVHLSGGLIEMHFHFFVMVAVVALYQDWIPFLAAVGYVFVHHGLMGAVDPRSVYNHVAAWNNPWKWAAVHALFITGISIVCLVTWRLNERLLDDRRRAEDQLRVETRIVETLHDVGRVLSAELDTQRIVQTVTDAATRLTSAGFGAFFYNVVDDAGESYMLYTLSGASMEDFDGFGLPRNTPLFAATFSGDEVVRLDDVTEDARYGRMPPHHGMPPGHLPVRSYLAVPVKSRNGDVLGGLFFGHPETARFTEVDERIVCGIASHASIAMDNADLYESEHRSRLVSERAQSRLKLLADASKVLTSSLDVDSVLRALARLVVPEVADQCMIDLLENGDSIRRVASADGDGEVKKRLIEGFAPELGDDAQPILAALRTGRAQVVTEPSSIILAPDKTGSPDEASSSAVVVPLVGRRGVLGAMTLTSGSDRARDLGDQDLDFTEELARRAAVAIENAQLYARQRSVAETLQHSLLPERLPEIPGLEIAARYLPGGPEVDIGGDWYDVIQLPDGLIAVALGDVVGRGERAAALMGQLRNAVRAYATEGRRPGEVVDFLNRLLHDLGPANMATMLYAVFEPETGVLSYVNAGHPPPLVVGPRGDVTFLEEVGGLPIGALPHARYTECAVTIAPGTTMVLYTDGLVEDRSMGLDDGLERLRAAVLTAPDDLDALCAHIVSNTLDGRTTQDDVAVLVLRLTPLSDRMHFDLPTQPSVLAPLRSTMRRWLAARGATEDETFEILVATGEACANAIQHATGPAPSTFELEAVMDGSIVITVRDEGRWRMSASGGGGRGLDIMRRLMDTVDVVSDAPGTVVTMRRSIGSRRSGTVVM